MDRLEKMRGRKGDLIHITNDGSHLNVIMQTPAVDQRAVCPAVSIGSPSIIIPVTTNMAALAKTGPFGVKAAGEYTAMIGAINPVTRDAADASASPVPR